MLVQVPFDGGVETFLEGVRQRAADGLGLREVELVLGEDVAQAKGVEGKIAPTEGDEKVSCEGEDSCQREGQGGNGTCAEALLEAVGIFAQGEGLVVGEVEGLGVDGFGGCGGEAEVLVGDVAGVGVGFVKGG